MTEEDFEGTLILENLAEKGLVEAFFAAVDADNLVRAKTLLKEAGIDAATIAQVLRIMREEIGEE